MVEKLRVLITVKTYPLPSDKYDELVCYRWCIRRWEFCPIISNQLSL